MSGKLIFNENGDRDYSKRRIFGGNSTNLIELTNLKYEWTDGLRRTMMGNFWIPEEIGLAADAKQYELLSRDEKDAFDRIICFLVFLDSLQTYNLPNINDYVTAPEVNGLLTIQAYQEYVHSCSYAYVLESVVPADKRQPIYDLWREDDHLKRRNRYIAGYYQEFIDSQSEKGFLKTCMANYILEGIYFYSGFSYFYTLADRGIMTGTATEIKYINRDENTHLALFGQMFREMRRENPQLFTSELDHELRMMMKGAVEQEIEWGHYVIGDRIEGLSKVLIDQYIKYLSNQRLRVIGLEPLYPEVVDHPMPWLNKFQKFNDVKTDFFEEKVINYSKSAALDFSALRQILSNQYEETVTPIE
jgi:ribonucleoside-diphosphate reductase beta chain